ncbi:MAG: phosphoribosylformylglycinamidine synthase subunit PurQ [Candidatus Peribacteraceae bacterium]
MSKPTIAVVSFPGNNCEFESLRAIARSGMTPMFFRWNEDRAKLKDVDGYFLVGGFSYEDRGRSGMVAARDPLMEFIGQEAEAGKVVIGNCNGAQILVESGLIPLDHELQMSLARNVIHTKEGFESPGFMSEWVWIKPGCGKDRCATSDWGETARGERSRTMHLPIAHGEGRFITEDADVIAQLKKDRQLAFQYCDAAGNVSEDPAMTPNGSMFALAGVCNPAGNVIALMPHPERTNNGKPYFDSMRVWIETKGRTARAASKTTPAGKAEPLNVRSAQGIEIFIDTIIVNNEERTVEQTAKKFAPALKLKQWKYLMTKDREPTEILSDLSVFNANKERAYVRRGTKLYRWDATTKCEDPLTDAKKREIFSGVSILRRDLPDTGSDSLGRGGESGICYTVTGVSEAGLRTQRLLEVFGNPHASTLEKMS